MALDLSAHGPPATSPPRPRYFAGKIGANLARAAAGCLRSAAALLETTGIGMDAHGTRVPASRTVMASAVLWLALVAVADVVLPPHVVPDPLFALSPLIACSVLSPRTTAAFGAAAVALLVASGIGNSTWSTAQQWIRLLDVVVVSLAAVWIAAIRVRREQHTQRIVAIAETAQRVILPTIPTRVDTLATATRYLSAAQDAVVGGDLYDYSFTPMHTRFIVGDVRGSGLPAVEQAARTIRAFRQSAALNQPLTEVAKDMDAYMSQFLPEGEFVTVLLIDLTTPGTITLVSCGHPPPLLVRRDRSATFLESQPSMPLGLSRLFADSPRPQSSTFTWQPGDRLLLYTDGLSEARDATRSFLPLLDLAPQLQAGDLETVLDDLLLQVRSHVPHGAMRDDLAVVLLERASIAKQAAESSR
ncbi:PP2C family protein-serine/threonine phosphatase [Nocardioides sp. CER19]|uniref:PP2C family protein-serine/threonine phosphatase n=1 Tax=Nocardioides sp. CER19 TaxID=3038538 RepID=UPI00244A3D48|nr:PP2C family protein-serine/threonine phosphatase [Nocardioides sp. CER19]MDH2415240.1 PP2C family protein-serine/threonine phosphatase [Nocardioides sp. CER19]